MDRPADADTRKLAGADPWEANCAHRERKEYLLSAAFPTVLMLPWAVFDRALEPALARDFLGLRVADFAVGAALIAGLVRSRRASDPLLAARAFGAARLGLAGVFIALMCPRVSAPHYFPYILGFSLVFWAMGIVHTWTIRWSFGFSAVLLGAYFVGEARFGIARPHVDEMAALFYLGSASILCIAAVETRRRLHHQAFLAAQELDLRNRELSTTVTSLREAQARLVESEKLSALGRLIASLSHEINNPVNVLRHNLEPLSRYFEQMIEVLTAAHAGGDVQALWDRYDLDFVLQDCIDAVATMALGVQRIQTVHSELRAFVRGDAPFMQVGDLNEGLRATANILRRSLPEGISIEVECAVLPPVLFQPGQIEPGLLQPDPERRRRHRGDAPSRRGRGADRGAGGRGAPDHRRHGARRVGLGARAPLRAILHDEAGGEGDGTGPRDLVPDRPAPRGANRARRGLSRGGALHRAAAGRTSRRCGAPRGARC